MNVLIVEDDKALGLFLQKGLKLEQHNASWVEDGEAALEQVRMSPPDLIVLDLSLPHRDGIEVLEELRTFSDVAVLVLTGRNNLDERIRCLDLGADDCLLKPFSFYELAARCRAILRRLRGSSDSILRHGGLEMDLIRRQVSLHGNAVALTSTEFSLLEFLLRRKGSCCSREELLTGVWRIRADTSTNVVDVYVNYLRKKLAGAATGRSGRDSLIETVRGAGYRILASTVSYSQPALARGA